jgi:hypothetical protein
MNTFTLILGIGLIFLLLTWLAIIDLAAKEFSSQRVKVAWGLAVAMIPFIGCLAYFAIGSRQGKQVSINKSKGNDAKV